MMKNDKKRKRTRFKQEPEGRSSTRLPWKKRKTSEDTSLISDYRLFPIISMVLWFVSRMFSRQEKQDKLLKRVEATLTRIEERDKMNQNNFRFEGTTIENLQICGDGSNKMDIRREPPAGVSQFGIPKPLYQYPSHPSLLAPVPTGLCHNCLGFQPVQRLPASLPLVPKYATDTQQETSRKSPAFLFAKSKNHNADESMLPFHMSPAQLTTVAQEQRPERELSGQMQAKSFTGPLTPEPQDQPRSRSKQTHSVLGSFITSHFQPALTSEPNDKRRRNDACTLSEPASGQKADWEGEANVDPITSAEADEEEDCFISDTSEKFDTKGSQQKSDMESESLVEADDGEEIFMPDVKSSMRLGTKAAKEHGPLLTLPASFQTSGMNKVRLRDPSHWTTADDTDPYGLSNPHSDTDFDSDSECEWMDDSFGEG
ncbi:uncharacterized protein [Littorina saxatilis]|uniref:uncharacterized protein n=1 Tax=Littorina saxatilis TaxID=31220 RepID=UPI0038B649E2